MILTPLYKLSTTGKVSYWEIEVEGNKFRTTSGFTDGKKFTGDWTYCEGKSYNNSEEQALKQAKAIHKKKKELGAFENIEDIHNPVYFSPMLAKEYEKEKKRIKYPKMSQPKLDGVRCITKSDGMWSRTGKPLVSAPHIFEALKPIFELFPDLVLDGELYCDKLANDFNKIISCVKKTKPEPEDLEESKKYIEYFIYDCSDLINVPFRQRLQDLLSKYELDKYKYVKIVPTYILMSEKELLPKFYEYVEQGYEGQILRDPESLYENKRSKGLIKHKDFITEELKIIRVNEGVGKLKGKVGTLTVLTKTGVEVDVAVNGTHKYLEELYKRKEELPGKDATTKYYNLTPDGSLRFPKIIMIDRWEWE